MAAFSQVELSLHDLFKSSYQTNCLLEQISLSEEEKDTLEDLNFTEVVENLKDLLSDLLDFKRQYRSTETSDLVRQSQQFEVMLQKLESEVRSHIRVEQQLKILLEAAQGRIDELEKELKTTQTAQKDRGKTTPERQVEGRKKLGEEKETIRAGTQKTVKNGEEGNVGQKPHKSVTEPHPRCSETSQKDPKKTSRERVIHKVGSGSSLRDGGTGQKPEKQAFKPYTQRLLTSHGPTVHKKREEGIGKTTEKAEKMYLQQAFHTFDATEKHPRGTHHRTSSDISKIRPFSAVLHPRSASTLKS